MSLFDGISCGRVALERAGIDIETYYASEIDKDAIAVSKKNYPDIIQLGDVNNINFEDFMGKIDLILGGFPCQDLSICNSNRKGLDGKRSGLFFKLLEAIDVIKPKYFFVENVASMSQDNKDIISAKLGVQPIFVNSSVVSAQSRKRLYWTNIPFKQENIVKDDSKMYLYQILEQDNDEIKQLYGVKNRYEETKCVNSKSGRGGVENRQPSLQNRIYDISGKMPALTTSYHPYIAEPVFDSPKRIGNVCRLSDNKVSTMQAHRVYSVFGKSVSLGATGGGLGGKSGLYKINLPDGDYYIRKLTPLESERLQTLPDNYTDNISTSARYRVIGNGWTVNVIEWFMRGILHN